MQTLLLFAAFSVMTFFTSVKPTNETPQRP